jgi:hypothetical protein
MQIPLSSRQAEIVYIGSLTPTFVPDRLVGLTVKLAYAFALSLRFPSVASQPLNASVTL